MIIEILDNLYGKRKNYQGLAEMIRLLNDNENFKNLIIEGIKNNQISGFPEELWEKINRQNIRGISNFTEVFSRGLNIDRCTIAAKQLSYSFSDCLIAGGTLKYLIDSPLAKEKDGRHTWVICNNKIFDTTLMLVINNGFAKNFGYDMENFYNPNLDSIYGSAKEFTNDYSLCSNKR